VASSSQESTEAFLLILTALKNLQQEWASVENIAGQLSRVKGSKVELHLVKIIFEEQRNHILRKLLEFYYKAEKMSPRDDQRKELSKARLITASIYETYMGAAALLVSSN